LGASRSALVARRLWLGACGSALVARRLWLGACGSALVARRLWLGATGDQAARAPPICWRIFFMAFFSSWRIRSAETP
ncbi:MAG: hypothetical protein U5L98_17115, partial [Halomonas sp.]|uniref:hypothetical protein n=1 Tax=Halomonas sp. TaxID=1486246 RepID=UPI002ACD34C9